MAGMNDEVRYVWPAAKLSPIVWKIRPMYLFATVRERQPGVSRRRQRARGRPFPPGTSEEGEREREIERDGGGPREDAAWRGME